MKTAVYSGSFDPLHIGHLSIMRHLTESGDFDMVYLVISPQSPFKGAEKARNAEERLAAAREAVMRYPDLKVKVEDIEMKMSAPQYTIRTLDALKARDKENDFTLVIGADQFASFKGWKDYRRILCEYGVIVFPREGFDCPAILEDLEKEASGLGLHYRITLSGAPLVNISSTAIREAEQRGADMSAVRM